MMFLPLPVFALLLACLVALAVLLAGSFLGGVTGMFLKDVLRQANGRGAWVNHGFSWAPVVGAVVGVAVAVLGMALLWRHLMA